MRVARQSNRLREVTLHAPMGSVNTISAGAAMPPEDCIYRYNMMPGEYGLRTRLGSREWCTGLDGEPRSLLPFTGSTKDGASNKLFACTRTGIWDVTSSSAAPTKVHTFAVQSNDSGWGTSIVTTTSAGHFLLYCDEENGYHVMPQGGAWAKIAQGGGAGEITGTDGAFTIDPGNLAFVMEWKHRVYFVEKDSGRGWYLPTNAIYGTAKPHHFGNHFKGGGDLRGLWSWTGDGGAGIDDNLVVVSGGGDVLVYQGTDPETAGAFRLQGVYFAGQVPAGRRFCTDSGGDLLLMSSLGILPIAKLVTGTLIYDRTQYPSYKIGNLFNQLQATTASLRGWAMAIHPQENTLVALVPTAPATASQQLVMGLSSGSWSVYRDMPMGVCAVPYGGRLYFGTPDGRVCTAEGDVDGVTLADPTASTPIAWSLLTGVSNLGNPRQKRVQVIRPTFLASATVAYEVAARYRWDLSDIPSIAAVAPDPNAWGTAVWDTAVWAPEYSPTQRVSGATGIGPEVAIAIRGTSSVRTILVSMDVAYDQGGLL